MKLSGKVLGVLAVMLVLFSFTGCAPVVVGPVGPVGDRGPAGPAGPIGPTGPAGPASCSIIGGNIGSATEMLNGTDTVYFGLFDSHPHPKGSMGYSMMPKAGTISSFYVCLNTSPQSDSAAKSRTFTFLKNNATTGLIVTVTGLGITVGYDTSHSVPYALGDTISIVETPNNNPANSYAAWTAVFTPS